MNSTSWHRIRLLVEVPGHSDQQGKIDQEHRAQHPPDLLCFRYDLVYFVGTSFHAMA